MATSSTSWNKSWIRHRTLKCSFLVMTSVLIALTQTARPASGLTNLGATNPLSNVDCGRRVISRKRSLFSSLSSSSSLGPQSAQLNIVNGLDAVHGQWPFNARVHMTRQTATGPSTSLCSGSVISKRYILTAAHCLKGFTADNVKVWVRDLHVNEEETPPGIELEAQELIIHPLYFPISPVGLINDIAMVKLKEDLVFDEYLQPVCLPSSFDWLVKYDWFRETYIVGWGLTQGIVGPKASTLQWARTTTVPYPLCFFWFISVRVMPFHICGVGHGDRGVGTVCNGDSGGPMVTEGTDGRLTVIGLTSFGFPGCPKFIPAVYTRVSWHLEWIGQNIDANQNVASSSVAVTRVIASPPLPAAAAAEAADSIITSTGDDTGRLDVDNNTPSPAALSPTPADVDASSNSSSSSAGNEDRQRLPAAAMSSAAITTLTASSDSSSARRIIDSRGNVSSLISLSHHDSSHVQSSVVDPLEGISGLFIIN